MSSVILQDNGNGKGHRTPPRLVCFGERIWIKIKEVLREESLERKKKDKRGKKKKVNSSDKTVEAPQSEKSRNGYFPLDGSGIRIKPWWEKEKWAMVTDPENPFGDLTREEEIRITKLVKSGINTKGGIRKWHQRQI